MSDTNSPINSGPGMPLGGTTLPGGGGPTSGLPGSNKVAAQQQQLAFENAIHTNADLAGIWDTIKNAGGDVWGIVSKVLPKNADGSVDWGKIGGDVVGFIKNNYKDILAGLSAYNSYQRQDKADALGQKAFDLATERYKTQEPLRIAGQAGMLDPSKSTPDLSQLGAMSQNGLTQQAALPLAAPKTNLNNAQQIAGPNSGNPFAPKGPSALPIASAPTMPAPMAPTPYTPSKPGALPLAPAAPPLNGIPTRPPPVDAPGFSPTAPGRPTIEPIVPKRRIAFDPNDPANLALPLASGA